MRGPATIFKSLKTCLCNMSPDTDDYLCNFFLICCHEKHDCQLNMWNWLITFNSVKQEKKQIKFYKFLAVYTLVYGYKTWLGKNER